MRKRIAAAAAVLSIVAAGAPSAGADTRYQNQSFPLDGNVWLDRADGGVCKIGSSTDLTTSTCLNASIVRVENRGFISGVGGKSTVRLYYNESFQNGGHSAYTCVAPRELLDHDTYGGSITFDHLNAGSTTSTPNTGYRKPIWHDIARVQWVTSC